MAAATWPWTELAPQAEVIARLAAAIESSSTWRWLEVGCSLAAGRGDEHSDVDAGVGYDGLGPDELHDAGSALVATVGPAVDVLSHAYAAGSTDARRFAVEYETGVQLDLVLMAASRRPGLPTGSLAVVDKDGVLARAWRPPVEDPPTPEEAREWAMLGWWALSDVAKYLRRGSLHEAVERLAEARQHALRLHAVGAATPFPAYGLVSLLDHPPYELPATLSRTYALPAAAPDIAAAAVATADLLDDAADAAGSAVGATLATGWAELARRRLAAVGT